MIIKKDKPIDFFQYISTSVFKKKEKAKLYKAYSISELVTGEPLPFNLDDEMLSISPESAARYLLKTLSFEDRTKFAGSEIILLEFTIPMIEIIKYPVWDPEIGKGEAVEWFGTIRFQLMDRGFNLKINRYRISAELYYEDAGTTIEKVENLTLEKID